MSTIKAIDQLWYTHSSVGLDLGSGHFGFTVRAASEGLTDLKGQRFQSLYRYLHYDLPERMDPYTAPRETPICLSFMDTSHERILVHKSYTGLDAVRRPGAFFTHLLAGLPANFSARDAIALWRSDFWQVSDPDRHQQGLVLPPLSSYELDRDASPTVEHRQLVKVQKYLFFVIQAYLSLKPRQHIYIAASADDVATIISGLTRCLPRSLLKPLTFSTYEREVLPRFRSYRGNVPEQEQALLVGTCWFHNEDLLAPYYSEHLAINSYTERHSEIVFNPQVARFADFAVRCLLADDDELYALLDVAEKADAQSVENFIGLYYRYISLTPTRVEDFTAVLSQRDLAVAVLGKKARAVVEAALRESNWWQNAGRPALLTLRREHMRDQGLDRAFAVLAKEAVSALLVASDEKDVQMYIIAFDILVAITSPSFVPDAWTLLLRELALSQRKRDFVVNNPRLYGELLNQLPRLLDPVDERIRPLLPTSLESFRTFLTFRLPTEWGAMALRSFLATSDVTPQFVRELASLHEPVEYLFRQIVRDGRQPEIALDIYSRLVRFGYPEKFRLLSILLDSQLDQQPMEMLLEHSAPTPQEIKTFFTIYGRNYFARYPSSPVLLALFEQITEHGQYSRKTDVLDIVLDSPLQDQEALERVLRAANLNLDESAWFFGRFGPTYLARYPYSKVLLELFNRLTTERPYPGKMRMLNILVNARPDDVDITMLHLTEAEAVQFMAIYGHRFFGRSSQSPLFQEYARLYLLHFPIERRTDDMLLSPLSKASSLPQDIQVFAEHWLTIYVFLKNPTITQEELAIIAPALYWLLSRIADDARSELLRQLARAFSAHVNNEIDLARIVSTIGATAPVPSNPSFLFQLIDEMVEHTMKTLPPYVSNDEKGQQAALHLLPYIQLLLNFEQFSPVPTDEIEKFTTSFLRRFLLYLDQANLKYLDAAIRRTPSAAIHKRWHHYKSLLSEEKQGSIWLTQFLHWVSKLFKRGQ